MRQSLQLRRRLRRGGLADHPRGRARDAERLGGRLALHDPHPARLSLLAPLRRAGHRPDLPPRHRTHPVAALARAHYLSRRRSRHRRSRGLPERARAPHLRRQRLGRSPDHPPGAPGSCPGAAPGPADLLRGARQRPRRRAPAAADGRALLRQRPQPRQTGRAFAQSQLRRPAPRPPEHDRHHRRRAAGDLDRPRDRRHRGLLRRPRGLGERDVGDRSGPPADGLRSHARRRAPTLLRTPIDTGALPRLQHRARTVRRRAAAPRRQLRPRPRRDCRRTQRRACRAADRPVPGPGPARLPRRLDLPARWRPRPRHCAWPVAAIAMPS